MQAAGLPVIVLSDKVIYLFIYFSMPSQARP